MLKGSEVLAKKLCKAQVEFFLNDLRSNELISIVEEELRTIYKNFDSTSLNSTVSRDVFLGTANRLVVDMEVTEDISELFGDTTSTIVQRLQSEQLALADLLPDKVVRKFFDLALKEGAGADQLLETLIKVEALHFFIADVSAAALRVAVLDKTQLLNKLPRLGSGLGRLRVWFDDKAPGVADRFERSGHALLESRVIGSIELLQTLLREKAYRTDLCNKLMGLWDEIKGVPLSELMGHFSEQGLQDLVVLIFESWLSIRQGYMVSQSVEAAVNCFYDKYGDSSLQSIFSGIGVSEEFIMSEVLVYTPVVSAWLVNTDIAEHLLEKHLTRFYFDEATLAILQSSDQ